MAEKKKNLLKVRVLPGFSIETYGQSQISEVFTLEPRVVDEERVEATSYRQPFLEIISVEKES